MPPVIISVLDMVASPLTQLSEDGRLFLVEKLLARLKIPRHVLRLCNGLDVDEGMLSPIGGTRGPIL